MFCLFIRYSKAFDSVWRVGLWTKLLASDIYDKCFQIIFDMYIVHGNKIMSQIMEKSHLSSQVFRRKTRWKFIPCFIYLIFKWLRNIFFKRIRNLYSSIDLQLYLFDKLFKLLLYKVVRYGAMRKPSYWNLTYWYPQTECWFEKRYPNIYVTFRIGATSNTNQFQAPNDSFLVINCYWWRI